MSTRKCAERAAIDLVVAKAFDLLVLHSSVKTNLKLKRLIDDNGGYGLHQLSRQLERDIQRHLMDSEVRTHTLLDVYVALSQASCLFREIGGVCDKLSAFIKTRRDLVNTLVEVLGREGQHVINTSKPDHLQAFSDEYITIEDDNNEDTWFQWMPHPRFDKIEEHCVNSNLTTLFSIFESKEKFLEQYQSELALRLLSNDWNKSMQLEVMQILRKFFSDREIESCEVMLWDIRNSEKLLEYNDNNLKFISQLPFIVKPKILSSEYWPDSFINISKSLNNCHMIHQVIAPVLEDVRNFFERSSLSKRCLNWSPLENKSNTVKIELEIFGVKKCTLSATQYEVSLTDAMIIMLFLEKEKWNFNDLKSAIGIDTLLARESIHRWLTKGFLKYHEFEGKMKVVELVMPSLKDLSII